MPTATIGNVKGDTGATPQLSVNSVTTLSPSTPAYVTLSGTAENPKLSFGIPKGEKGDKGDTGSVTTGGVTGDFHVTGDLETDGYMSAGDGAAIIGGLSTDTLTIGGKKPFVTYINCQCSSLATGAQVTGLNYSTINSMITNGGFPVLSLTIGAGYDKFILHLASINIQGLLFETSVFLATGSGLVAQHYYVLLTSNNSAFLSVTNI